MKGFCRARINELKKHEADGNLNTCRRCRPFPTGRVCALYNAVPQGYMTSSRREQSRAKNRSAAKWNLLFFSI